VAQSTQKLDFRWGYFPHGLGGTCGCYSKGTLGSEGKGYVAPKKKQLCTIQGSLQDLMTSTIANISQAQHVAMPTLTNKYRIMPIS